MSEVTTFSSIFMPAYDIGSTLGIRHDGRKPVIRCSCEAYADRVRKQTFGIIGTLNQSERQQRAQTVNSIFVLRALATREFLQQRKSFRHCAQGKPAIHANHNEKETTNGHLTRSNLRNPAASFMKFATDSLVHVG